MTVREEKQALRARCRALRDALAPEERAAADAALCRGILAHPAFRAADLVLGFSPMRGEPDLVPVFRAAAARGIPTAFPFCTGDGMRFLVASPDALVSRDRFGIPAPAPDAPEAVPTARTLCILPGLAAGEKGERLGYGGGFYDAFLDTFPGICLFPVYESLLLPTLPTEPHDRPVDVILTEKGVRHVVSA